ncbi:hypothetical protein CRYUN_Cryun06bG0125600 [Craigia yunnanensis]
MLGMGSALETLCGQAFGAGQLDMLAIYMQRSWIILNSTALILSLLYIFAAPILKLKGQTSSISKASGIFSLWMIPQLFAYAVNFPMAKFLQAQSKMMVMALAAGVALVLHTIFSWLLMLKLAWDLVGAAIVLNASWIFIDVAQFLYIVSGTSGRAWTGFSWKAFHDLWGFVKLSLASAVMLCLEIWYFMALILFAGYLKNTEVSVDALSIWNDYPYLFSNDSQVQNLVKELTPLLALCIVINNVQPVLSGMAIGAGWQAVVAYVNIACYYLFGVPLGLTLGFALDMGVKGIWCGMLSGTVLQTCILFGMIYKTNWNKEASIAGERIKKWGGVNIDSKDNKYQASSVSRMDNAKEPLLSPTQQDQIQLHPGAANTSSSTFTTGSEDIPPITGVRHFFREFFAESKKLWYLAGPAMFTSICKYSLGAITQVFAGHVGTLALAAVSIENSVIAGFSFGVMLGMGSALETLCGQAFGAGQIDMLGVYMQRSWIILNSTALILLFLYIFAEQILKLIGQTEEISEAAGIFAMWMIPQLFAYAMNFPMAKFLQSQSKIMAMAVIAATALVLHTIFSWLLMLKLGWGLIGAAVVLNASWIFIDAAQFFYIISGTCGRAWTGFSWKAFQNLWGFVKLSLASAVMLCLEVWYFMALILFAGYLKNAQVSVDALSICCNILGWTTMVALGMNVAVSVRVSNELGAGHPRKAKLALLVAVISSFLISLGMAAILIIFRDKYPALFSTDSQVKAAVKELTPLLAFCITLNNVQPVLSGVAVGAGWQAFVAYVNIGCYYIFGIPLGLVLGFKFDMGVKGIWCGMISGTVVQTCILFGMIYRTNWNKEASIAEDRITKWGGHKESIENNVD